MHAAFRSGAVMGFLLASLGLLVLYITIKVFGLVRTCRVLPSVCIHEWIPDCNLHAHHACMHEAESSCAGLP